MRTLYYLSMAFTWTFWFIFLASLFLPAYDGMERPGTPVGTPLLGWQAMVDSIVVLTAQFWVVLLEPRFFVLYLIPFGTAFVLHSPLLANGLREDSWPIAVPLIAFSAMMWVMPSEMYEHTLYGFWAWNLSPVMMAIAMVMNAVALRYYDPPPLENKQNNALHAGSGGGSTLHKTSCPGTA